MVVKTIYRILKPVLVFVGVAVIWMAMRRRAY
jgi:hypothetical protein